MAEDPCKVFRELQRTTWHALGTCYRRGILLGEDAITTLLLVNIATRLKSKVVYADRRPIEAIAGCDFELLIGSSTLGWYRYAIQAKRLSNPSERYYNLDYKVGKAKVSQRLILRKYAARKRAKPLYGFYNYLDHFPARFGDLLGVTIAPLQVVERALSVRGGRNFDWIHRDHDVVPWSVLVCPDASFYSTLNDMHSYWNDLEDFRHEKIPADLSEWFDRGSIASIVFEEQRGVVVGSVFNPSAVVKVDLGSD